jgi:hypothetical protein
MDILQVYFPVSGVETSIFIPPLVAFVISFFSSMAGITGAFVIINIHKSVLGFFNTKVTSNKFI